MLLIVRDDDMVHDVAIGKIFHRPAEMGSVDPEHRRTLADRGGEEKDLLICEITLQSINQVQTVPAGAAVTARIINSVDPDRSARLTTSS